MSIGKPLPDRNMYYLALLLTEFTLKPYYYYETLLRTPSSNAEAEEKAGDRKKERGVITVPSHVPCNRIRCGLATPA